MTRRGIPSLLDLGPKRIRWASDMQREAYNYGPSPLCLSGGWGSGKTYAGVLKALYLSTEYKRNRGVIARHVGKELRETTMKTFFKICTPDMYDKRRGGRRNDQQGYVKLADSESEILFIHLDNPETQGIISGLEINWFLIDQAEEAPTVMEENFNLLMGRLSRWDQAEVPAHLLEAYGYTIDTWPYRHPENDKPVPPSYPMLTCNPDVETHWLYRYFHEESPDHQEIYKARGYHMFHMPSDSNRFANTNNLDRLQEQSDAFQRRNRHGLWGQPEGAIHIVDKLSLIDGSPEIIEWIQQTCVLYRTLDHGDTSPTCCIWWAVDREGNSYAWQEYYMPNTRISMHRQNITSLSEHMRFDLDLADPSIFHKMPVKQGGRASIADEYSEIDDYSPAATALSWRAADNNELGTRNRINEYLRVDPRRIHPITRQPGSPRLFFVKKTDAHLQGIVHALVETRNQRRVKIGMELGRSMFSDERDPDIIDHAYDNVRYHVASRPAIATLPDQRIGGTFKGAQQLIEQQRRNRNRR